MGRPRPRSDRSPRAPAGGKGQGERARLRRNQPLTWRSAFLWLVPLALLAAGADVVFVMVATTRCPHCRGHHVPLDITAMALALTALAVYACVSFWKGMHKGSDGPQSANPLDSAAKKRATEESP